MERRGLRNVGTLRNVRAEVDRDIVGLTCEAQTSTDPAEPGEDLEELGRERSCLRADLRELNLWSARS